LSSAESGERAREKARAERKRDFMGERGGEEDGWREESGVFDVATGFHFVVEEDFCGGVGADDFLDEFVVDRVVAEHFLFREVFEVDGNEEGEFAARVDAFTGAYGEGFRDFEEEGFGSADHFLEGFLGNVREEFVESDVMDHAGG
jgi:hypothetical protein